jgi:hypothetical protein
MSRPPLECGAARRYDADGSVLIELRLSSETTVLARSPCVAAETREFHRTRMRLKSPTQATSA